MKLCSKCKRLLDEDKFNKDSTKIDGYFSSCKECRKIISKNYNITNKDKLQEKKKIYHILNKDKILSKVSEWRKNNIEYFKESCHNRYIKNKDILKDKYKEYKIKNAEKVSIRAKKYREKNKEDLRLKKKIYKKNRLATDYKYKLKENISTALRIKIYKKRGTNKYLEMFGYNIEQLIKHLENKFIDGMSWDNYGKWHIDHIKPQSLFNLDNEEELKKCWSLSNLQPLWAIDNIKKSNKYPYDI